MKKRIIKVNEESVISVSVWVTTTLLINNQLTLTAEDTHSSSANIKGKVLSNNAALLFHRIEADKNTHTHIRTSSLKQGDVQTECILLKTEHLHEQLTHCAVLSPLLFWSICLCLLYVIYRICVKHFPEHDRQNKKPKRRLDPGAEFITSLRLNDSRRQ